MNNYSTLPYGNNLSRASPGLGGGNNGGSPSPGTVNTAYGTIAKPGQRHRQYSSNAVGGGGGGDGGGGGGGGNYEQNEFTRQNNYGEEDNEWTYPSNHHYILAKNIQNVSGHNSPAIVLEGQHHRYPGTLLDSPSQQVHHPNIALNHTGSNGPHAIYIQNTSGTSSPSFMNLQRTSPYNNGSLQRRTPVEGNFVNTAAVVKQLQEKFHTSDCVNVGGGGLLEQNIISESNLGGGESGNGGMVNASYETITIQRRLQQQQQQNNGGIGLTGLSGGGSVSFGSNNFNREPGGLNHGSGGGNYEGMGSIDFDRNNSSERGGGGVAVGKSVLAGNVAPGPDNDVLRNRSTDNNAGQHNVHKSALSHCRLPLFVVLAIIMTVVFVTVSAVLFYFKYVPYKVRGSPYTEEPCEETKCAFGASCVIEGGLAHCRCPDSCVTNYAPVCGTDGTTYSNECLLRTVACQNQKSIRVRQNGECDTPDPCAEKVCLFGSRCVASGDGRFATCECPTSCPNYGDSDESHPVCGSDGKYYRNRCELDREACRLGRNITVRYTGKCDPCEDLSCPAPEVCHLDEERRPGCRCGEMCPMDFNPVCGSDGKTYSNECVMRQEACRGRREIRVIYRGKCSSGTNPCETRTCRGYETCAINKFGIAQCSCGMKCDPIISPVCGSDARTYDSHCDLMFSSCREGRYVTVAYHGTCESGSACATHTCPPGATCSGKAGGAVCECPSCPSDYDPVCGSDGVSYQNECKLKMEACLTNNSNIRVLYAGLCNGCDRKQCDFYGVCVAEEAEAKCVCPKDCKGDTLLQSTPVCGTDGITYKNECELRKAACQHQKFIVVASKGHCDLCASVNCKFGGQCENGTCVCPMDCPSHREPVCGSNLMTYANECELQKAACKLRRGLSVHFYGDCTEGLNRPHPQVTSQGPGTNSQTGGATEDPSTGGTSGGDRPRMCEAIRCDYGAVCELGEDGFPRCTCQFNCTTAQGNRVCGSDLKLYPNECEMRKEGCQRQSELRPRPMELCEETEIRACNGESALKNPETGEDINCGSGPSRTSCPSGSYCHKTSTFAKCCKKPEEKTTTRRPMPRPQPKCDDAIYGCCPDGVTGALGEDNAGCPSVCQCNKLGSIAETCDPFSGECRCRPGVGTPKCDRCLPGFWGLSRIVVEGHLGCRECGCSKFGSVRDDCEQMTGRCVCKPGVLGHKCDSCAEGEVLGPYGCTSDPINLGRTCSEIVCSFGAECEQDGNRAGCVCNLQCSDDVDNEEVCASDGFTYESECLVRLQSCRTQKGIWILHKGSCPNSGESDGTESPIRRWTVLHYTEPGDEGGGAGDSGRSNGEIWSDNGGTGFGSSSMKSTRHLLPQTKHYESPHQKNFYSNRSPTTASIQVKSYLGDSCVTSVDCVTSHSVCLGGWCICREGYYEDLERIQCKAIHSHISGALSCNKDAELCQEPSSCIDHRNGSYSCLCPLGKSGANEGCGIKEPSHPFFTGRSTITLGKLAGYHKLSLEVEMTPYLNYAHGVLIFSSQHGNGTGDFLSLALIDGFVEFRYDLGDGPALLRSINRVVSGTTYHIVAKRYNRDGLLRVDGDEEVKGTSPGTMKSLNLNHGSFMGFVPMNSTRVWELVGTSEGFVGCVHKLKVGRRPIDFVEKRDSFLSGVEDVFQCPSLSLSHRLSTTPMSNVLDMEDDIFSELDGSSSKGRGGGDGIGGEGEDGEETSTCTKRNPCHHHGQCWNDKGSPGGYKCVCHPEFTGKHCESRTSHLGESGAMLDFRGFTYLELPRIENGGRHVNIELWFMVRARNCLILYNGQEAYKGDFIAILMFNGHLQFLFDLGSGVANITWAQPISMNKWHWVVASREGREGKLQVDGKFPQTTKSPGSLSELNLELPLYFGGVRDGSTLNREISTITPFDGSLQYLRINGETYHREISDALEERLVHRYEGPPCGSSVFPPCGNGGVCLPRLDSHVCLCPPPYSGKSCEGQKDVPGPIRFDGQNYLQLPLKIDKHRTLNVSEYDDVYNDHFDSQLDELFGPMDGKPKESHDHSLQEMDKFLDFDEPEEFVPILDEDFVEKFKTQSRNRIEVVFRTTTEQPGLILWAGKNNHGGVGDALEGDQPRRSYLGLFIVDGFPEVRIDLDATKNKKPVIIRSKVKVNDNRWHQILIARRKRSIVVQVDGSPPRRATAPVGTDVLVTDGRFWIGGVSSAVLPAEIPASYHQGFVGCVDLVRIEKRRLPLTKLAYATGIPFCEDYSK